MSVLGILDAMRSDLAPAYRLVWACLENHANGARWWPMTNQELADELHLHIETVARAVQVLEGEEIIRREFRRRRKTVFHMLRTYPAGATNDHANAVRDPDLTQPDTQVNEDLTQPDTPANGELTQPDAVANAEPLTPEIAGSSAGLTPEIAVPSAELTQPNTPSLYPPDKNPPDSSTPPPESVPRARGRETRPPDDQCRVFDAWNAMAEVAGLPLAMKLTDKRRAELRARLREHGVDGVLEAIDCIARSRFCRGENDRGWKADFDFLLQPKSLTRAREGFYADRSRAPDPANLPGFLGAAYRVRLEIAELEAREAAEAARAAAPLIEGRAA